MRPNERLGARHRLASKLLGSDGGWISMCREAVTTGSLTGLDDGQDYWEALGSDTSVRPTAAADSAAPTSAGIARAILNIAHALTGHPDAKQFVLDSLELFDSCGHSSPSGFRPPSQLNHRDAKLADVQAVIEKANPDHPSATFASLLARYISGDDLTPIRTVVVPVLFDQLTSGSVGHLRISEIRIGPIGIHPHPGTMAFLVVDKAFNQALRDAWAISPLRTSKRSLVWELTDAKTHEPLHHVAGASLGAAWYVALDELKRGKFATLLRPRKLDPNCAATGSLNGTMLASVKGYENKFKAATASNLRVVYPAVDSYDAERAATRYAATVTPANDAPSAVRATRTRPNRWATLIISTMVAGALGIAGTGATLAGQLQQTALTTDAQNLINQSQSQLGTDPRRAALYALAANKLRPSTATRDAMLGVIDGNQNVIDTIEVSDQAITHLRGGGENLVAAAADRHIFGLNPESQIVMWDFQADYPIIDIATSSDGFSLAVQDEKSLKTYSLRNGKPALTKVIEQHQSRGEAAKRIFFTGIDAGTVLVAVHNDVIRHYNLLGDRLRTVQLPSGTEQQPLEVVAVDEIGWGNSGLLALSDGRVLEQFISQGDVKEVLPPGSIPGRIAGLASTAERIAVATDKGLISVSRETRQIETLAQGGVASAAGVMVTPNNMDFDGGVAVLQPSGLSVVPFATGSTLSFSVTRKGDWALTSMTMHGRYLVTGDVGGRITLFRPGATRSSQAVQASAVSFAPDGQLFAADASSGPRSITRLLRLNSLGEPPANESAEPARYSVGNYGMYVNHMEASREYIVAAGQSGQDREYRGVLYVWKRTQEDPTAVIEFSATNSSSIDDAPDIVTQAALLDKEHRIIGFNIRSGQLKTWSLDDFRELNQVEVGSSNRSFSVSDDEESLLMVSGSSFTSEGSQMRIQLLSTHDLSIRWSVPLPGALGAWFMPKTATFACLDNSQQLTIRNVSDGSVIKTFKLASPTKRLVPSSHGDMLALIQDDSVVKLVDSISLDTVLPPLKDQHNSTILGNWSPDDTTFVGLGASHGSTKGRIQATATSIWPLSEGSWNTRLCAVADWDLTDAEWDALGLSSKKPQLCLHGQSSQVR